ncbi:MAG TPA: hypothetical protein VD763_03320, partial [Candidatus Saccharimonadales bacterium]|nr:hypothetical protein [Candidatus Saccharimonadales bacterium]
VAAATLVAYTAPAMETEEPVDELPTADTTATFEDVDGNGVDDDCQTDAAVADPAAAAIANAAVDLDGDGVVSTSEAAHSARTGGTNCNHGGYVSQAAQASGECETDQTPETTEPTATETETPESCTDDEADAAKDARTAQHEADKAARAAERAAAKAERAAEKAARTAERAAKAAERQAAKEDRAAEREAAKAERTAAKGASKVKTHGKHGS